VFVLAHNPDAPSPFVTWQGYRDVPGYDWGHYYSQRSDAHGDLLRRSHAERTGIPYDYTEFFRKDDKARER